MRQIETRYYSFGDENMNQRGKELKVVVAYCDRCRCELAVVEQQLEAWYPFRHVDVFGYQDLCISCYDFLYAGGDDYEEHGSKPWWYSENLVANE